MRAIPLWVVSSVTLALGCAEETASPDLVQLTGVSPQVVESGDTVQIAGHGFPEGSPARLSFQGDVFRAGQAPKRGVEVIVRTQDTSKDTITLVVNDELENAFCGVGDTATHAVFRGTVRLAFAASANSLAPISGNLKGVTLEVLPRFKSVQSTRERQLLSQQALNFLGLHLAESGQSDCCTVATAEGRALLAGIKSGDKLIEFDGVPVRSPLDLVPSGRNRTASVSIQSESSTLPVIRNVDVQGFRWTIPSELAPAFAALLLVLGFIAGFASPVRKAFLSLSISIAKGIERSHPRQGVRTAWNAGLSAMRNYVSDLPLPDLAALKVAQLTSVIAIGGLCGILAVREELVSGELDLVLWWLVSTVTISLGAFALAIARLMNRFAQCLLFTAQAALHQFPLLLLIASSVIVARSAHLADIVRMQGAWPHNWLFVHDPAFTITALLAMAALIPTAELATPNRDWVKLTAFVQPPNSNSPGVALLSFATNQLHLWVQSVLLATLLFGGWSVPGATSVANQHPITWMLLATLILLLKSWLIISVLSAVRSLFQRLTYRHTAPWVLKFGSPWGLLCGLLTSTWVWGVRYWALPWADTVMHWVMLSLVVAFILALALSTLGRIRHGHEGTIGSHWI